MAVAATRYFTFSTRTGNRRRVPADHAGSDSAAILYARATNASNVVREDGPQSRPVIHMLWAETDPTPATSEDESAKIRTMLIFNELAAHFPDARLNVVRDAAEAVEKALR